jgi:predicted esterase
VSDHTVKPFQISFTTYYATQEPGQSGVGKPPLLLALHGWGQNARRFLRDFRCLKDEPLFIAAPQGPHQFYLDTPDRKVGFNWLTRYDKASAIRDTNAYLARLLEHLQDECPYDPQRIYLMGFSQGVSMAWRFAVSGLVKPAGMVACCADLASDVAARLPETQPFPVYLAYGKEDPLVPADKMDEAIHALRDAGFPCKQDIFDGGHELPEPLLERVAYWITEGDAR